VRAAPALAERGGQGCDREGGGDSASGEASRRRGFAREEGRGDSAVRGVFDEGEQGEGGEGGGYEGAGGADGGPGIEHGGQGGVRGERGCWGGGGEGGAGGRRGDSGAGGDSGGGDAEAEGDRRWGSVADLRGELGVPYYGGTRRSHSTPRCFLTVTLQSPQTQGEPHHHHASLLYFFINQKLLLQF